jgi:hypothetical protein
MMLENEQTNIITPAPGVLGIGLSEMIRVRLGQELQAMYDPIIDEALDPRLAELLQQLDRDRT